MRFNTTVRDVTIDFVVSRFAIIVIAELAAVIIGQRAGTHVQESRNLLLAVWGRWDAVHYLDIATYGYHGTDMAFFPLYPLLIKALGSAIGYHLVAGLLISNIAFFFGLLFLYKLVEHEFDRAVARRAIFYISIFPTALYFSAVYPESLFFMLTVASFYYMRERRWWLAGSIGFFAALTRVEGVLLIVPFAIEWYSAHKSNLREGLRDFGAHRTYPGWNSPLHGLSVGAQGRSAVLLDVQVNWNRHLAAPWTAVINTVHKITHLNDPRNVANQVLELGFTALMISVLIAGWKRVKASYIAYMGLSILLPMSTSSLMSMPRFALVLFPMFVIFAVWGRRPGANNAIVALSLPLLGLFTVLFADWYWALNLTQRRGVRQFVKFGTVGFTGLVVNFVIAHALQKSTSLPHAGDFAIGYMAGGISNWYLNRVWTFRSSAHPIRESVQFLAVSAITLGLGEISGGLPGRSDTTISPRPG